MSTTLEEVDLGGLPPGLGSARPVELAATRYQQGGRTQYHIAVPVAEMARLIVQRPDPNRPLPGNRKVDAKRANDFAKYILTNDDWVSPAIIVRVPKHEVHFTSKAEFEDGTAWGVLAIPLDVLTEIVLLDGQHRTLGIFDALEMINDRIKRLRETISGLKEQIADPVAIRSEEKRLEADIHIRKRLSDEHISIDIAEVGENQAKQMFGDINNNAKGVNPDFKAFLDQRDIVNRIAVEVMESHVLLQDRVEVGQSGKMTPGNENFIGVKGVADISRAVLVGTGRVGARVEDEIKRGMAENVKRVSQFLDVLVAAFDDLRDLAENRLTPKDLRARTMLGSSTMLRVLAATYHQLTRFDDAGHKAWSRSQVEDFFHDLSPLLERIPIAENDKIWIDTGAFLVGSSAPIARQGTIKTLVDVFVGWAESGLPQPAAEAS